MTAPRVDWPKSMTAYGVTMQRETLEAAWEAWLAMPAHIPRGALSLQTRLELQGAPEFSGSGWFDGPVAARIADRMLQRARKAGVIRWNDKAWEKVEC